MLGTIEWFDDSPGLGRVKEAREFVATAAAGLGSVTAYRPVSPDEILRTFICRVARRDGDRVELTFMEPGEAARVLGEEFALIQGPHPIARVRRDRA